MVSAQAQPQRAAGHQLEAAFVDAVRGGNVIQPHQQGQRIAVDVVLDQALTTGHAQRALFTGQDLLFQACHDNRIGQVSGGTVDLECGTTTVTLGRQEQVDFSSLIFVDAGGVILRADSPANSIADLAGNSGAGTTSSANFASDSTKKALSPGTPLPMPWPIHLAFIYRF